MFTNYLELLQLKQKKANKKNHLPASDDSISLKDAGKFVCPGVDNIYKWLNNLYSMQPEEIICLAINKIGETFQADRCLFSYFDKKDSVFIPKHEYLRLESINSINSQKSVINLNDNWIESLASNNKPIFINKNSSDLLNNDQKKFFKANNVKSYISAPLIYNGEIMGAICLHHINSNSFWDINQINLLKEVLMQISIAIKQAELYRTTKKQAEREALLRKIIEAIRGSLDINKTLEIICQEIADLFKVDRVVITQLSKSKPESPLHRYDYKCRSDIQTPFDNENFDDRCFEYWTQKLLYEGKTITIDNLYQADVPDYLVTSYKAIGVKSIVGLGIKNGSDKWGVLGLITVDKFKYWTQDEISLIESIADQIYLALKQSSLYNQAQESIKLKSQFIATISHEFRTPLTAIIGFSEMIKMGGYGELTDKGSQFLDNVVASGKHLLNLVNDILDLSKVDSGNLKLQYEKFDTRYVIEETASVLINNAVQKNIKIELELSEACIMADIVRFRQIIYNLLSNAIKFTMNDGRIKIKSFVENELLRVEVEDTGIGIAEKDKENVFVEFKQMDSSYSRYQNGTGLGLALTKKLVELHKGTINFESKFGIGSKFWFLLPFNKPDSDVTFKS